jgi:CubicO group peptidase (beta-lactamase class C family)
VERRIALCSLLLSAVATGVPAWAAADTTQAGGSPDAKAAVEQVLTAAVERHDTPGAVGLVVDRNGVLFEGAAGELDVAKGTALTTDAIFNIASMTKPVTSVAVMMLVEQGKLMLDDPVSKYLPGFDKLQVITQFNEKDGTYETRPAKNVMTVRHLMTHTSGIGYGFSSPVMARLQQGNSKLEWELPLLHEPGARAHRGKADRRDAGGLLPEAHFPSAGDG